MGNLQRLREVNLKDITFKRVITAIKRRIEDIPDKITWNLPFAFTVRNRKKIQALRNKHLGKRCFIVANGPSLKYVDFSLLKDEYTIGMNRIYMMKEQNGYTPTYLACIDLSSQLLQFTKEYDEVEGFPVFYNWKLKHLFSKKENQYFLKDRLKPDFSTDLAVQGYGTGWSVCYVAIQLAYYLGFKEVYIIGKDHSYNTTAKPGNKITSTGSEGNHFMKGYYKPGMTWVSPDYQTEEYAYKLARKAYEKDGRIIKDATVGGKLEIFEKVDFNSLFK